MNIKYWRKKRGMTQEQLAEKTGVCQSLIARLETRPGNPTLRTLRKIADALKVDVGELI